MQHIVLRNHPTLSTGTEKLACLNSPPGVQSRTLAPDRVHSPISISLPTLLAPTKEISHQNKSSMCPPQKKTCSSLVWDAAPPYSKKLISNHYIECNLFINSLAGSNLSDATNTSLNINRLVGITV